MEGALPGSLTNILEQTSLKWIFVGGKGGVGKTTVSSALAVALAGVRASVLLISTDPAHNLSDAFMQRFSRRPEAVQGVANLYAMEIDPQDDEDEDDEAADALQAGASEDKKMLAGLAGAMPGIDEAMSFSKVMKLVQSMEFDVVVFDTAPTGHTLRFLQFPDTLLKTFGSIFQGALGGLMTQMMGLMGGSNSDAQMNQTQEVIAKISAQFRNPDQTQFVAVTIAEFLPMYETERLLQELAKQEIDCRNIVVNQILDFDKAQSCEMCKAKSAIQQHYLRQLDDLYEGLFHMTYLPAISKEVRGKDALREFSPLLLQDNASHLKHSQPE